MPAAKKTSSVRRRTKLSSSSSKSHASSSAVGQKQTPSSPNIRPNSATWSQSMPSAPTRQPMPMPVVPERMPSQVYTPLIRTTYNSIWLKRLGIGVVALLISGVSYAGWSLRGSLSSVIPGIGNDSTTPPTHLNILITPTPDVSKLEELSKNPVMQSSSSGALTLTIDQASSSAQLNQSLQAVPSSSLEQNLKQYIKSLEEQQVNTNNLKAYQEKIDALESQGQAEQAHQWLVEALVHAHELAILNNYYNK